MNIFFYFLFYIFLNDGIFMTERGEGRGGDGGIGGGDLFILVKYHLINY